MNPLDKITTLVADRINDKNRYYVLAGVLVSIFLIDYFLILMPQMRALISLNPKIQSLSKDIKQTRDDIAHKSQYEASTVKLRGEVNLADASVLSKEEIPRILDNIALIASNSKIKITQMTPLKEAENLALTIGQTKFYALPISVSARADYHNFGHFINRLEQDGIFMAVTDFDMAATSDDPVHHAITMKIKTLVFEGPSP